MSVSAAEAITLSRYILASQHEDPQVTNDLSILLSSVELACKAISSQIRRASVNGLYGLDGSENSTGDQVKKLDVLSNNVFINALKYSTKIQVMVSEENEEPIILQDHQGKYCIAFDPLDGSSNIDCNVSTGTIFAIYKKNSPTGSVDDILQPGRKLKAAGYCMYGSSTQLVLTWGEGVHAFTLDPTIGTFVLAQENMKIPDQPKRIYSVNEGNYTRWDAPTRAFVEECKNANPPYSARYVGSMVSDVHRTLMYGGIFMYPGDSKSKDGKLRLLYEANPMSFIVEQAGGKSTTGTMDVLDIVPKDIHERAPIFLGSARDVDRVIELYKSSP